MSNNFFKLLLGDPKRAAYDTNKAYDYQFWQSLLSWVELDESQLLCLEGAEDIDKYCLNEVSVTQVKHLSKPITLRSPEIIEALNNFWKLKNRNPRHVIKYRFLTIAEITGERGSPFGDKPGLKYWQECRYPGSAVEPLRDFLLSLPNLSNELREFIQASPSDQILRQLVEPISWYTGSPSYEEVQREVDTRIVYHGDRWRLTPEQSRKAIAPLIQKVRQTACNKANRFLEKKDFLEEFEKATFVPVPVSFINYLAQVAPSGVASPPAPDLSAGSPLESMSPPLPQPLLQRAKLVAHTREDLGHHNILVMQGASSVGKTTLARLLTSESSWRWLSLRGVTPNGVVRLLKHEAAEMDSAISNIGVVLDDLDFNYLRQIYETYLIRFFDVMMSLKKKVVITSQTTPPASLGSLFPNDGLVTRQVPYLDYDEVFNFAKNCGCPSEEKLDSWVPILLAKTKGHPSLLTAWTKRLMERNWPDPSLMDIVQSPDIADVLKEARQRLADTAPSEEAKDLAYRLSVIRQPFRKDHAVKVAASPLAYTRRLVAHPGQVFDFLVGPWIEPVGDEYYRISPLLEGSGEAIFGPQDLKNLHKVVSDAFYYCKPVTYVELKGMLIHGLAGEATEAVTAVISSLIQYADSTLWTKIRQDFDWILGLGSTPGRPIYPANPWTSQLLRFLQYRIATELGRGKVAASIRTAWESEIQAIHQPEFRTHARTFYLAQLIMRLEVAIPLKAVANAIMEILSLVKQLPRSKESGSDELFTSADLASGLMNFITPRCSNMDEFQRLFEAIEEDAFGSRSEFLALLEENLERLIFIFDPAWTSEYKSEDPNWQGCLELFEKVARKSIEWRAYVIASVAYRCIAVIYDEHLSDRESAFDAVSKGETAIPIRSYLLEHVRAGILHHQGDHCQAINIWALLMEQWKSVPLQVVFLMSRWGQMSAAAIGDWNLAAQMAHYAETVANDRDLTFIAAGFRADKAFALWKSGEIVDSVLAFESVLDSFEKLPDPETDLGSRRLQRFVGHAIGWLRDEVRGRSGEYHWEPHAAEFSDPELGDRISELTIESPLGCWWMLADVECRKSVGDVIFRRLEEKVR